MRLFYAITFTDNEREQLQNAAADLHRFTRQGTWSRPENLHLTLHFLGEQDQTQVPRLIQILNRTAEASRPFDLLTAGCGTFGRQGDILWLGFQAEPRLDHLVGHLQAKLRRAGWPIDERPFRPHLTLGRQIQIQLIDLQAWHWPAIRLTARHVALMESLRLDGRLVYRPLAEANLSESPQTINT